MPEPLLIDVPGFKVLRLTHLVMDVNGTLALDGVLLAEVFQRLKLLQERLAIQLLTADTNRRQHHIDALLGYTNTKVHREHGAGLPESEWKAREVEALGAGTVVAMGNGRNDRRMLEAAALGIAVMGPEGVAVETAQAADIIVPNPAAALDLLLHPNRLVASLRDSIP